MAIIDKDIFEKAGARGCSNSDYNLAVTNCCCAYVVEDDELHDIYFDPKNTSKVLDVTSQDRCPICNAKNWDYKLLREWPREPTAWQWAYHPNQELVSEWLLKKP